MKKILLILCVSISLVNTAFSVECNADPNVFKQEVKGIYSDIFYLNLKKYLDKNRVDYKLHKKDIRVDIEKNLSRKNSFTASVSGVVREKVSGKYKKVRVGVYSGSDVKLYFVTNSQEEVSRRTALGTPTHMKCVVEISSSDDELGFYNQKTGYNFFSLEGTDILGSHESGDLFVYKYEFEYPVQ